MVKTLSEFGLVETRHLIASKAVVEKEVSEGVVEVGTKSDQAVRLVGVGQLPEGYECGFDFHHWSIT